MRNVRLPFRLAAQYIPPFYAHHVSALSSLSVSVAVWSDSDEAARRDELERLPLPWEANWTQAEITLAAAQFLRSIMVYAHLNSTTAARRALQSILTSRYEPLRALPVEHQEGLLDRAGVKDEHVEDLHGACRRDEAAGAKIGPTTRAFERVMSVSQLQSHVDAGARRVADAARAIAPHDFTGIGSLCLANYVEAVADFVVGRGLIFDFLSVCVLGSWGIG